MQGCTAKRFILPKATCFINAQDADPAGNSYNARCFCGRWLPAGPAARCSFPASSRSTRAALLLSNTMKLHSTPTQHYQTVTGYDATGVEINAIRFSHSLVVLPEVAPVLWPPTSFDMLSNEHFSQIEATVPDVVILGTGERQRFVHPKLTAALNAKRIGVECMDNQAACRTYNILMAEGRKVALALIFEENQQGTQP